MRACFWLEAWSHYRGKKPKEPVQEHDHCSPENTDFGKHKCFFIGN